MSGRSLIALVALLAIVSVPLARGAERRTARVVGSAEWCGGPAPGRCGREAYAHVAIVTRARRVVAFEYSRHGRFAFRVPPGRYTLILWTGNAHVERGEVIPALPPFSRSVTAVAGRTVSADLVVPVP